MSSAPPLPGTAIRVVFVEDHDMVAEAIGIALGQAVDIDVAARSGTIAAGVADVRRCRPDVVVLDRRLPDGDAVAAIGQFGEAAPGAAVLVLTGEATAALAARVVAAGGAGLVSKSSRLEDLEAAVRKVAAGEPAFGPDLLAAMLDRLTGRNGNGSVLTTRELETLALLGDGASTDEICERMGVARNTARNHVQRVLEKLGARSKLEAVAIARREGLLA